MRVRKSAVFIFVFLILMILSPAVSFDSVKNGVSLFAMSVLPSMLPYFFFTKIFTAVGGAEGIASTVGKPVARSYKVSPVCGYAFVMSLLSGYPVGARVLGDLYEKGYVDKEDVLRASSFSSTSGSMFVLGSVGSAILGNLRAGWVILISHYLGAVLNGLVFCLHKRKGSYLCVSDPLTGTTDNVLSEAMYESVLSLALVGGFIAMTNLMADMISGVVSYFDGGLLMEKSFISGLFYSFFEVTRGCVVFSECGLPTYLIAALSSAAVSFGGLSVLFQTLAFLGKAGVRFGDVLLRKISQAAITFFLCLGIGAIVL